MGKDYKEYVNVNLTEMENPNFNWVLNKEEQSMMTAAKDVLKKIDEAEKEAKLLKEKKKKEKKEKKAKKKASKPKTEEKDDEEDFEEEKPVKRRFKKHLGPLGWAQKNLGTIILSISAALIVTIIRTS